jgi:CHASE2 domain-containing sensor protein
MQLLVTVLAVPIDGWNIIIILAVLVVAASLSWTERSRKKLQGCFATYF